MIGAVARGENGADRQSAKLSSPLARLSQVCEHGLRSRTKNGDTHTTFVGAQPRCGCHGGR